ncbi:bifunctional hydroxymethylpyrimidine kinase/phosphomethylpyrimidine kinase [Halarcobacter bivalviorum]|uniref:hydroxymethylpyrimidine kinase n=1 Tax=Halarcobacter bivalviorum TaxID=663364 RepID=A0AAX2ADL6_9BACT|nr:bifunctional hydroxymethylpyrimidine kinase/phosphomethylpyrimidine kinase [Halarcobacter bivalviorum]AXH12118.1 hydroxymethylpyrimidine kinase / phosphohydroxymethylpyrimidine kinase [Halarcobacter bivalviorum]RXK11228.1 bifunctional hydroxymethylpyrimidine kinase/phosphomethylpyrimidine kinase [Halarcobacter bivalviorum]
MKVVLTIAGSDSSGGAGIQADLKTFEAFDTFGCSALTVLTAQNTQGVTNIQEISPSFVQEQILRVLEDFEVSAIKIGMLFSNEIIDIVRETIKDLDIPIVFDPVFISKAGSKLLNDDAIENLKTLFPYVNIITPNLYEAKALFDYDVLNEKAIEEISKLPCKVVIKNDIVKKENEEFSMDTFFDNKKKKVFYTKLIETTNNHGTGCSFSSAITANIALGKSLEEAIKISKEFIYQAILNAPNIGHGKGPIAHKKGKECL